MSLAPLRRSGWVMVDYAVSAATNMLLTIMVARSVSPAEFGIFALLYGYYVVALELSRAAFSEPLLVRLSTQSDQRRQLGASAGAAALFGVVAATVLIALSMVLFDGITTPVLILAISLPGLLIQDALRLGFVALGHGHKSLLNDSFWGISQCAVLCVLFTTGAGLKWALAAWAGTGISAAGLAMLQARVVPRFAALRGWMRDHGRLARPYAIEVAVIAAAAYSGMLMVSMVAGVAAVGALRAGNTLLGLAGLVCAAGRTIAISEFSRVVHSPSRLMRTMLLHGGILAAAVVSWEVLVMSLPASLGVSLVGASWSAAREVLPPLAVVQLVSALVVTVGGAMRALEAIREQFALRMLGGALAFLGPSAGAAWGGAFGAAAGLATVNVLGCVTTILVFLRLRARSGVRAPHLRDSLVSAAERGDVS